MLSLFSSRAERFQVGSALGLASVALGLIGPSCFPLSDLDTYGAGAAVEGAAGEGNAGAPATGGTFSGTGGLGGAGGAESVCGNGVVEGDEACDEAGTTERCNSSCALRKCPLGCQCWMEGSDLIKFCPTQVAFSTAEKACRVARGVLDLPESAGENGRLSWQIAKTNYAKVWLGGNDIEVEGTWVDEGGNVFWRGDASGEAVDGHFTAWEVGQPNNVTVVQNCAYLHDAGLWGDTDCADLNVYACRVRGAIPSTCGNGELDSGEACDDGGDSEECDADCTVARCGDGYRNAVADEECDGGSAEACTETCRSTGLVAHFPLTERRGAAAYDVANWTRSGHLLGDAKFTSAADGVVFGQAGAISVAAGQAPSISGQITIMAYIRPEALPTAYEDLVDLYTSTNETYLRFNGALLEVGSRESGTTHVTKLDVTSTLVPGAYTHVAGTYDGASWRLFIDGQVVSETASAIGAVPPGGPLVIGGREDLSRGFDGKIVDVRLYEKALSQGDVQAVSDALHQQFP